MPNQRMALASLDWEMTCELDWAQLKALPRNVVMDHCTHVIMMHNTTQGCVAENVLHNSNRNVGIVQCSRIPRRISCKKHVRAFVHFCIRRKFHHFFLSCSEEMEFWFEFRFTRNESANGFLPSRQLTCFVRFAQSTL